MRCARSIKLLNEYRELTREQSKTPEIKECSCAEHALSNNVEMQIAKTF